MVQSSWNNLYTQYLNVTQDEIQMKGNDVIDQKVDN